MVQMCNKQKMIYEDSKPELQKTKRQPYCKEQRQAQPSQSWCHLQNASRY